jgi:mannose-6-phosphate isomerase-like protein (cupin superfamily)
MGDVVTIKAATGQTNGSLTVLELLIGPKQGPALHTHLREDELWYVIDGDFRFKAGGAMLRTSTGGMAFGPRGTPHAFQNIGDTPGDCWRSPLHLGLSASSNSSPRCCPARSVRRP